MAATDCTRCKQPLSKPRLQARKRKCYRCEVAVRREGKQHAHDRAVESMDFTAQDYWDLYAAQDEHCFAFGCRAQGKSKFLAVEHDHSCEMGHDKSRWCRACVRGLACVTHNEWIGRAGDDPAVFDSIAEFLRNPPAREILMEKMVVGSAEETLEALHYQYGIQWTRGRHLLDMARGVGPSPTKTKKGTIVIRYIRIPRTTKVLYEIVESEPWLDSLLALKLLMDEHDIPEARAKEMLNQAWKNGRRKVRKGVTIQYRGRGAKMEYMFSIE